MSQAAELAEMLNAYYTERAHLTIESPVPFDPWDDVIWKYDGYDADATDILDRAGMADVVACRDGSVTRFEPSRERWIVAVDPTTEGTDL